MTALLEREAPIDKAQYNFELGNRILPISIDEFYEIFLTSDGTFSTRHFYKLKGYKDIKVDTIATTEP